MKLYNLIDPHWKITMIVFVVSLFAFTFLFELGKSTWKNRKK